MTLEMLHGVTNQSSKRMLIERLSYGKRRGFDGQSDVELLQSHFFRMLRTHWPEDKPDKAYYSVLTMERLAKRLTAARRDRGSRDRKRAHHPEDDTQRETARSLRSLRA